MSEGPNRLKDGTTFLFVFVLFINNLNIIYKSLAVNNSNNNKCNNKLAIIIKNLDIAMKDLNTNSKNIVLLNYSSLIYNKGISANNLLEYFTNCSNFKSDFLKFVLTSVPTDSLTSVPNVSNFYY